MLVLSQLDPNHSIFTKSHTKALAKKKRIVDEIKVPNPMGFFDGLQIPYRKNKGRQISFKDKNEAKKIRMRRLKDKIQSLNDDMLKA